MCCEVNALVVNTCFLLLIMVRIYPSLLGITTDQVTKEGCQGYILYLKGFQNCRSVLMSNNNNLLIFPSIYILEPVTLVKQNLHHFYHDLQIVSASLKFKKIETPPPYYVLEPLSPKSVLCTRRLLNSLPSYLETATQFKRIPTWSQGLLG